MLLLGCFYILERGDTKQKICNLVQHLSGNLEINVAVWHDPNSPHLHHCVNVDFTTVTTNENSTVFSSLLKTLAHSGVPAAVSLHWSPVKLILLSLQVYSYRATARVFYWFLSALTPAAGVKDHLLDLMLAHKMSRNICTVHKGRPTDREPDIAIPVALPLAWQKQADIYSISAI